MIRVTDEAWGEYQTVFRLGYFDIRSNQGRGKCCQSKPKVEADDISDIVLKRIMTSTSSREKQTDIENHALRAQPTK